MTQRFAIFGESTKQTKMCHLLVQFLSQVKIELDENTQFPTSASVPSFRCLHEPVILLEWKIPLFRDQLPPKKNVQNLCRLPFWNVKFKNPSSLLISPVISWVVALDQCQQILTSVRHPPTLQPPFSPAQKWHPPQKGEDQEWPCRKASPPRFHQDSTYFGWMFACFPYFPAFSAIRHVNCQC